MKEMLYSIWRYRHFILSSIKNDLRSRFARSKLGAAWMILQPLAQVAIYALVLSRILAAKLPGIHSRYAYVIYLMAGMVAWALFNEVLLRSMNMFVDNGNLMKKIVFPRVSLPLITAGSALVNNVFLLVVSIVVIVLVGHPLGIAMIWLPVLVGINLLFSISLGLILGVLNVFLRDVAQVMNVVLQLLFWMTPIVYMPSIIPPSLLGFMKLNPLYHIVTDFQDVVLFNREPGLVGLTTILGLSLLMFVFALFLFRRAAPEMADVL